MGFPAFFDDAPVLRLRDRLSELLGATPDGVIEYRYADAVRLAGHSCPTVAGAWLCARAGLRALYGDRSEEHTSELQSLMRISYAVFCLKKKITKNETHT